MKKRDQFYQRQSQINAPSTVAEKIKQMKDKREAAEKIGRKPPKYTKGNFS